MDESLTRSYRIVGGLAKREGLRVIGSVGSDQKVELMKNEFGFDHVFNYKKQSTLDELRKFEPIQIYFDNVRCKSGLGGGEKRTAAGIETE